MFSIDKYAVLPTGNNIVSDKVDCEISWYSRIYTYVPAVKIVKSQNAVFVFGNVTRIGVAV